MGHELRCPEAQPGSLRPHTISHRPRLEKRGQGLQGSSGEQGESGQVPLSCAPVATAWRFWVAWGGALGVQLETHRCWEDPLLVLCSSPSTQR